LRALLDELHVFGVHEKLDARIEHYLAAGTIPELYQRVLERYEEDYERDRAGLVRDTMSLLWAARRGLSEAELLDLLGTEQGPLPRAHWSPLYLAANQSLMSRSGLIGFGHDYLLEAVRDKYLPTEQDQQRAHLRLADYFDTQSLEGRKVDELPWQLTEAKAWQRVCDLLTGTRFLAAAWSADQFNVKACWARIETGSALRLVDAYRSVLDGPVEDADHVSRVGILLNDTGHPKEALSLQGCLVDHFRQKVWRGSGLDPTGNYGGLTAALHNQANILYAGGEFEEAVRLCREAEWILREFANRLGNKYGLAVSLNHQALILKARGRLDEAMGLLKEAERSFRELDNKDGLQACLGNQAVILQLRSEVGKAMRELHCLPDVDRGDVSTRVHTHTGGTSLSLNGQRVVWDLSYIFRFDDQGRLTEDWVRTDYWSSLRQLGAPGK
jgi:tetratricopeptide (TPR) repeat protein